jgi:hypothetical protein
MRWLVAQAVTWIAFGDAQPIGNWGKFTHPSRQWPVQPATGLLGPLEALARGAGRDDAFDPEHWSQAKSLTLQGNSNVLIHNLRKDLEEEKAVGEKIDAAGERLWRAVREGRLDVYAVPAETPFAKREKLDPDLLARFPLTLRLDGRVAPARPGSGYKGPTFVEAAFEANEVQELWPAVPAQAVQWMLAEARGQFDRTGKPAKQADLVKRCVAATGCTNRAAKAAHKELPSELRYTRGSLRCTI